MENLQRPEKFSRTSSANLNPSDEIIINEQHNFKVRSDNIYKNKYYIYINNQKKY